MKTLQTTINRRLAFKIDFYIRSRPFLRWLLCLLSVSALLPGRSLPAQEPPQDEVPLAPRLVPASELYRVRVENILYGSVSLSADGGLHYILIGRVTHPATAVAVERAANQPGEVLRNGADGLAFAVNLGQTLKLRSAAPAAASGKRNWPVAPASESSAILTNLMPRVGLFGDLVPPVGTQVKLLEVATGVQRPFPTLYEPSPEDVFLFVVPRALKGNTAGGDSAPQQEKTSPGLPLSPENLQERFVTMGQAYVAQSFARARQERQTFYSGTLTLKARLPAGEPDPILYVTYVIDNREVSTQNVAPFDFAWDTRQVADGEHVIEIRALNRNVHLITFKRSLVLVQNKPN